MKNLFSILALLIGLNCFGQNFIRDRLKPDTGVNFLSGSHISRLEPSVLKYRDSIYLAHTQTTADDFHQVNLTVGTAVTPFTFIDRGIIVGQGYGGAPVGRSASSSNLIIKEDTFFLYTLDGYGFAGDSRCIFGYYSVGNPYNWVPFADTVFVISDFPGVLGYGNTSVWPERVGGKFHALIDTWTGGLWETHHAESYQLTSGWVITHKLDDLQVPTGGMHGGCQIIRYDGVWHIFYHYGISGGNLPTYLAYATSTDDDIATATIVAFPIMPYFYGHWIPDVTQIADPWILEVDGKTYMWAEIVVNESPTKNEIRMWTYDGQFYKLIKE